MLLTSGFKFVYDRHLSYVCDTIVTASWIPASSPLTHILFLLQPWWEPPACLFPSLFRSNQPSLRSSRSSVRSHSSASIHHITQITHQLSIPLSITRTICHSCSRMIGIIYFQLSAKYPHRHPFQTQNVYSFRFYLHVPGFIIPCGYPSRIATVGSRFLLRPIKGLFSCIYEGSNILKSTLRTYTIFRRFHKSASWCSKLQHEQRSIFSFSTKGINHTQ